MKKQNKKILQMNKADFIMDVFGVE
jgi:hypothetical protein